MKTLTLFFIALFAVIYIAGCSSEPKSIPTAPQTPKTEAAAPAGEPQAPTAPATTLAPVTSNAPATINLQDAWSVAADAGKTAQPAVVFDHKLHQEKNTCTERCHATDEGGKWKPEGEIKGMSKSNGAHAFCWTCHEDKKVPKGKVCITCHRYV